MLVDTHGMLFFWLEPDKLSPSAAKALADGRNQLFWSVASSWEVAIKVALGKLDLGGPVGVVLPRELSRSGVEVLPVLHEHVLAVADLPRHHGDPFDRLLVATAQVEGLTLLTRDPWAAKYGVTTLW